MLESPNRFKKFLTLPWKKFMKTEMKWQTKIEIAIFQINLSKELIVSIEASNYQSKLKETSLLKKVGRDLWCDNCLPFNFRFETCPNLFNFNFFNQNVGVTFVWVKCRHWINVSNIIVLTQNSKSVMFTSTKWKGYKILKEVLSKFN